MPPLPRGLCPVCGHEVALRKNTVVREHWVRDQVMGDGEVRAVVASPFSGEVCDGSGRPPAPREPGEPPHPRDGYDRDDPKRLGPGGLGWPE